MNWSWNSMANAVFTFLLLFMLGCTSEVTAPKEEGAISNQQANQYAKQCAEGECPCSTPLGVIKHGTPLTVYNEDAVACGESCSAIAHSATCNDGELESPIENYKFTCRVEECQDCIVGVSRILHGENTMLYSQTSVSCSEDCESFKGEVTCNDGELDGIGSFQYASCQRQLCHCELPDQSSYLSVGGSRRFYQNASPACGSLCDDPSNSQNRTCQFNEVNQSYGFDGSDAFSSRTCTDPVGCECTLPNGTDTIADGAEIYLTRSPLIDDCEEVCPVEDTIGVRCENSQLVNIDTSDVINLVTTEFRTQGQCQVRNCASCDGGIVHGTIPHGEDRPFYQNSAPACGSGNTCNTAGFSITKTCSDGTFMPDDAAFPTMNCYTRGCDCDDPANGRYNVSVGGNLPFYPNSQLTCGISCPEALRERTCEEYTDGVQPDGVTPIYKYRFTEAQSPFPGDYTADNFTGGSCIQSAGCDCTLPNGMGTITDKTTVNLYRNQGYDVSGHTIQPPCAVTCNEMDFINARCDSGTLRNISTDEALDTTAPGFLHINSCQDATCANCVVNNDVTPVTSTDIPTNALVTLYPVPTFECGDNPITLAAHFSCYGGVLKKNGNTVDNGYSEPGVSWYADPPNNCTKCTTPWGTHVNFGDVAVFYKASSDNVINPCGAGCKSVTRTCQTDGSFDGIDSEFADYTEQACPNSCSDQGGGAPPRLCLLPWSNSYVTPNGEIPMYSKRQVGCGESCKDYYKLGKCDMNTGTFDAGFEYIYPSCTKVCNE